MFVSHHLNEVEESYRQKYVKTPHPELKRVLDILELQSHWRDEEEDGLDVFDFTLPEKITNYVISVRFGETGEIEKNHN